MYTFVKRLFDILLASVLTLLLLPILLPVMLGLKFTGEGYIWYFQQRVGYKNKLFDIWKFATMLKDSPNMSGGLITLRNDPRLTPLGGFLRATKINELPQLINILKGDMSFVGPRPVMKKSFDQYPSDVQQVIYNVVPGLTGIGSVIFRNEEDLVTQVAKRGEDSWEFYKNVIYPYKGKLEQWYQQHQSLATDFKILVLTGLALFLDIDKLPYRWFPNLPEKRF
jgi:lipopolysaccharide/colanic/teichoic acid biosynthesis glycosyltransferase